MCDRLEIGCRQEAKRLCNRTEAFRRRRRTLLSRLSVLLLEACIRRFYWKLLLEASIRSYSNFLFEAPIRTLAPDFEGERIPAPVVVNFRERTCK